MTWRESFATPWQVRRRFHKAERINLDMKSANKLIFSMIFFLIVTVLIITVAVKKREKGEYSEISFFAMDTYMSIVADGGNSKDSLEAAKKRICELEALLSTTDKNSEVYRLNHDKTAKLSYEVFNLIKYSVEIGKATGERFDIAVYPAVEAWGFTGNDYNVLPDEQIQEILPYLSLDNIIIEEPDKIRLNDKAAVDLGGIAKGYATYEVATMLRENGTTSALINLGGNVYALGCKNDGSPWRVAVKNPNGEEPYLGVLSVSDMSVVTSGDYERYFEIDGHRYHHIIDSKTGCPADNDVCSATVVSSNATLADALSTAIFVYGEEGAEEYWRESDEEFQYIMLTKDNRLIVTEGLVNCFESDFEYSTVKK